MISLRPGMVRDRDEIIRKLVDIQYTRNQFDFKRGTFRAMGDVLIYFAIFLQYGFKVEFFGDELRG